MHIHESYARVRVVNHDYVHLHGPAPGELHLIWYYARVINVGMMVHMHAHVDVRSFDRYIIIDIENSFNLQMALAMAMATCTAYPRHAYICI